jgi:DNA polymerase-1
MKNVIMIKSQRQLRKCMLYLMTLNRISLDTETLGMDCHTKKLLTLQVGNKERQYVIDCKKFKIRILKPVLETKLILAHNMKFDWQFMYHAGIDIKIIYDTFLAECVLTTGYKNEERTLSLKGIAKKYLDVTMDKTIRGKIHSLGLTDEVIDYAAGDIEHLEDIMDLQLIEIEKWDLQKVLDLENRVVRVFAMMEYNGISFDSDKLKDVAAQLAVINKDLDDKLDDIIVQDSITNPKLKRYLHVQTDLFTEDVRKTIISWTSPKQKTEILNCYGLNVDSVNDKTLQKLKTKNKIIPLFIDLSKFTKLETSFGYPLLKFINPITKRIHASVWQVLSTGRISMSEPNLQQIPSHSTLGQVIKSCFIATQGCKIVSSDYSGFELAIIAELSQDPIWIKILNDGRDLHSELCALTFNIPIEDVKKPFPGKPDISYRFLQKTLNFGLAYGMSKFKLSEEAQVSLQEADKIIKMYFSKIPKVEIFLNMVAKMGVKNGYIRTDPTVFRRIRWFPNLDRKDFKSIGETERASKNTPPQGTNASVIKQALVDLQDVIDNNNYPARILLSIHDELVTECEESFVPIWKPILEETMINAAKLIIKSIPVKVEEVVSDYWTK